MTFSLPPRRPPQMTPSEEDARPAAAPTPTPAAAPAPAPPPAPTAEAAPGGDGDGDGDGDGQTPSDTSKLKTFVSILKKFVGVSDMAAVRFSLPAQLLEPTPNLEYWHYLDRPETFAAIGDSDDPLQRMLACLRFWFTKDLKFVKGKPCKPYNSALGEFFRCTWAVEEETAAAAAAAAGDGDGDGAHRTPTTVAYITEQTSHHPPVSAYAYRCAAKGIEAVGYDQLSARFTGASVKVTPGAHNRGIFITLARRDGEEYHLTHPPAFLGGFLRGQLSVSVAGTCSIACAHTGLKTLLHYVDDGYFGKPQNRVLGLVYRPADVATDAVSRLRDVPPRQILGRVEGVWTDKIFYQPAAAERQLLLDLAPLAPAAKTLPPPELQLPNESRRFWAPVTRAIHARHFARATAEKLRLEERQREAALARARHHRPWRPRFFLLPDHPDHGRAVLSHDGRAAMRGLQSGDYRLPEPDEYAAF